MKSLLIIFCLGLGLSLNVMAEKTTSCSEKIVKGLKANRDKKSSLWTVKSVFEISEKTGTLLLNHRSTKEDLNLINDLLAYTNKEDIAYYNVSWKQNSIEGEAIVVVYKDQCPIYFTQVLE